jgi:hypothetical protein
MVSHCLDSWHRFDAALAQLVLAAVSGAARKRPSMGACTGHMGSASSYNNMLHSSSSSSSSSSQEP